MTYAETLHAYGIPPEQVARDLHADALQFFRNRENAKYGRYEPDPPSDEDVRAAYEFKLYGVERDAD